MSRSEGRALLAICIAFACAYAMCGLFRHWHFGSSAYDLGIFDQAVWHLSRFEAPASTISGFSNILGDHFYPIIGLFAPMYWLAPAPETLIVAQAALFAASIVPVYLYFRGGSSAGAGPERVEARLPLGAARALAVAYGLFWGLQRAAVFDVHEMAFAPVCIAIAILAMDRQRWRVFWVAAAVLVLVKEDLIPLLSGFGLYLIWKGERKQGAWLLVLSLALFVCITSAVIPAFNNTGGYAYSSIYRDLLRQPWRIPVTLVTPPLKIETAFLWLAPFLLLSLASPLSLLIIPLALERFLSPFPQHWGTAFHYSAPLAPIVAMSAGDGLARLARQLQAARADGPAKAGHYIESTDTDTAKAGHHSESTDTGPADVGLSTPTNTKNVVSGFSRTKGAERYSDRSRRLLYGMTAASVVVSAVLPGNQPLWRLFTWDHYASTEEQRAGYEALRLVPIDASVVAQAAVVPHLSQRERVFMLQAEAPEADYVIAAAGLSPWPASRFEDLQALLNERQQRGYSVLFQREGWIVLARPGRQALRLRPLF